MAPSASPPRDHALLRQFALWGALAIALFAVAMALILGRFLESRMLLRDAVVSRDFVQSVARTQRLEHALASASDAGKPAVAEFVTHLKDLPDVLRANLYSTGQVVLWSSDAQMIGRRFSANDELDQALAGAVVVHAAHGPDENDKEEHVRLGAPGDEYVENYVPVVDASGQRVIAVVELYRRRLTLLQAIAEGQRLVWLSAIGGGVFLFLCLMGFVWRTQQKLHAQQRQLVEADALALVGEIAAAVAHSIRNPLGSIRSTAELQRELAGDPDGHHEDVMRHVDRIEHLVRSMLSYAAVPGDPSVHADLDPLVGQIAERAKLELARQRKPFTLEHLGPLGHVAADGMLMAQVLQSLVSNAAEATSAGQSVGLSARRAGVHAVIEVRDGGSGMADATRAEVFRPFYTTKPRGLGMGLALAQRVVHRLGGEIHIDSAPGQGSCVRVTLPVSDPTPGPLS